MINLADLYGIVYCFKEMFRPTFTLSTLNYDELLIGSEILNYFTVKLLYKRPLSSKPLEGTDQSLLK